MKDLATRMRDDLAIVAASLDRKDARIAALEAAIDGYVRAKDRFLSGGHVIDLHRAEEAMFRVLKGNL
jgi:hypothetical protein